MKVPSVDLERAGGAYRQMLLIRAFENAAEQLQVSGAIRGSQHQCVGQEATAVGVCQALRQDDVIFITYRGHGQALAKGMTPTALMAELLGRSNGCCGGFGGSMHLTDVEHGVMVGNAIVAAGLPMAVGAALTFQLERSGRVAVAFFGDGATNQGAFHEALNLASLWKLPTLFICENNLYSEMTPLSETTVATDLVARAAALGVPGEVVDGNDVEAVRAASESAVAAMRAGGGPWFLELSTWRQSGHMVGDAMAYRDPVQSAEWLERDPVVMQEARLLALGVSEQQLAAVHEEVAREVERAVAEAQAGGLPDPARVSEVTYA